MFGERSVSPRSPELKEGVASPTLEREQEWFQANLQGFGEIRFRKL